MGMEMDTKQNEVRSQRYLRYQVSPLLFDIAMENGPFSPMMYDDL